ncbi:hypothetical protein [Tenuibacillus multivorans]|uniref:Lipoprotein n=1 Tax=Tenuibacillus multivorans TaxID=237069 RepID=A0A1G9Z5Z0_9BACI|nr:hypothetical protein [Tenuibacillus multivorans]GEL77399.1 hypothetical protein TMU01_16340 [Tenuibacillus multivorans]SDN16445.1 hypothetical protein SAMN05216498_1538 [Tenuibacillus multivorans]
MNLIKVGLFILSLLCLIGYTPSYDANDGFKESTIQSDIPVPVHAQANDVNINNPNIKKGKKYNLENIGGENGLYRPQEYFQELENWGWQELKVNQMGHVHFFKKGKIIISIVIKEDNFNLFVMKENFQF